MSRSSPRRQARPGYRLRHAEARAGVERARGLPDRHGPERRGARAHGPAAALLGRPPACRRSPGPCRASRPRASGSPGGKLYNVVAAPVLEGGARLDGVIAAAFQIDDEVARNLEQLLNTQVVFLADAAKPAEPAKAALAARRWASATPPLLGDRAARRPRPGRAAAGRTIGPLPLEVGGETYVAYVLPIRSSADQLVGAAVALRSRENGARAVPADPEHAGPGRPRGALIAFVCPSSSPAGSPGPSAGSSPRPSRSAWATSTRPDLPVESEGRDRHPRPLLPGHARGAAREGGARAVRRVADLGWRPRPRPWPRCARPRATRSAGRAAGGQVFAARYEIQCVLGAAAWASSTAPTTATSTTPSRSRRCAARRSSADRALLDRFKQEIRLARRITHPNILRTHDLGERADCGTSRWSSSRG